MKFWVVTVVVNDEIAWRASIEARSEELAKEEALGMFAPGNRLAVIECREYSFKKGV